MPLCQTLFFLPDIPLEITMLQRFIQIFAKAGLGLSDGSRLRLVVVLALLGMLPGLAGAASWLNEEEEFLSVDQAFELTTEVADNGDFVARWEMPDGYYLYKNRFNFQAEDSGKLGAAKIPSGKVKVDEWFGEVEVYYHEVEVRVPVLAAKDGLITLAVGYQGCADAGLCYPPETKNITLAVNTVAGGASPSGGAGGPTPGAPVSSPSTGVGSSATPALSSGSETEEGALAARLASDSFLTSLLLFLLAGIGLAFTPCVLPMVPILSSIIVGDSEQTTRARAFGLSVAYVLGMAITYASLGVVVGLSGASLNLQTAMQSPLVLSFFALVFVALSMSMFGFYELQLPQRWQNGLNALGEKTGGGKHLSVFVMGALSALVVSPCVSAPLAGALIYLSSTEDAVLGGAALLSLGLGMGVPLLLIGATGGHFLPKAGVWMNAVKAVFGVLLLGVAIWLLERVVPAGVTLLLWAALAIGCAVYLGALDSSPRSGWAQLWKAGGTLSLVYGVLLMIGAASGAQDPLRPLAALAIGGGGAGGGVAAQEHSNWIAVNSNADIEAQLTLASREGVPVILDMYADWCIACKVMERNVFPDPEVAGQLQQFRLLRADVTDNSAEHIAMLERYELFGPPSLVFFRPDRSEIVELRIQGEKNRDQFANHLNAVLAKVQSGKVGELAAN